MSSDSAFHSARERLRSTFGPDFARNRARFAMYHEMFAISGRTPLVRPTAADVDAFALAHPGSSSEMRRMERVGSAALSCGAVGGLAAGAVAWRQNRMAAYAGIGALLGAMSASFLADNVRFLSRIGNGTLAMAATLTRFSFICTGHELVLWHVYFRPAGDAGDVCGLHARTIP